MTQPQHSAQFLRKRKMMLVLPVLVLPFICIFFVALGGGEGGARKDAVSAGTGGYNMALPDAHFAKKETVRSKLAFYEEADKDSAKLMERIKQDPYHLKINTPDEAKLLPQSRAFPWRAGFTTGHFAGNLNAIAGEDSNANKLLRQLDQLKQALHRPVVPAALPSPAPETNRLEKLMQAVKAADTATSDPQLEKLSAMLDKIIRIQHPGGEQITPPNEPIAVADLVANPAAKADSVQCEDEGGFYSIDEPEKADPAVQNTIAAVIPEDQTLVAGATITLRLTQDAAINGITIPKDMLVYGMVSINGDRMRVAVSSIRYRQGIYPVSLQVYDMDGLAGIHIPGAITRDVAKESAGQGISSVGLNTLDPSLAGQAATAGIAAAKTLMSRKIRLVQVSVKAGYQILLKNTKTSTH
jgi:conjugative transposon TraM protein